jgi:hypothetical protein
MLDDSGKRWHAHEQRAACGNTAPGGCSRFTNQQQQQTNNNNKSRVDERDFYMLKPEMS